MEQKDKLIELSDMIDNFYIHSRQIRYMENSPRYYGSDVLLYPNEIYTLKVIAQREGINQTELTDEMFRTKGATSVAVRKLIDKGLVEQRTGEPDHRINCLYPTEKGRSVYEAHLEYDMQYLERLSGRLQVSLEELIVANRVLRRMVKDFKLRREEEGTWQKKT